MSDLGEAWSLESVLRLRDRIERRDRSAPARDERFHEAAALLSWFELTAGRYAGAAAANLITDSVPANESGTRWTLKNSVRRRVLKQLGTRSALRNALRQTAERPDDLLQLAIDACVEGSMKPLAAQTSEELAASMQVVDWLGVTDLREVLPAVDAVQQKIEYAGLLDPLRALAGANFVGRATELATLAGYVESQDAAQPPMLIFGPGGMGKSSLLAKFVLDRIAELPIVYLDFDRPGLAPQEPITLLAEAVRQLGLQRAESRATAEALRREWLRGIALSQSGNANTRGRNMTLDEFRAFVTDLDLEQSTILLAIDTFEEVQYRSRTVASEVALFLGELRERLPRLRTVIAGRNPASDFAVLPLELGELDQEASQGLLRSLGVESADLQRRLARLLHGNPLSIRLAVELLKADDSKGLDDIEGLTDDTAIQGVLYGRILGHIHLKEVKNLAHPGLILRRITADLIREVLAEPCGVRLDSPGRADALFTLLRNELSLVVPEGDAVRHRPDVRRVMLEPLRRDRKDVVRRIEEAAIKYYVPFDDVTSRAEEIYHRLSVGQPREEIDPRWLPGIEDSLRSAIDELPPASRSYLAARLGVELYDQNWDDVDQKTWEDYAARQSEDLLKLDRPLDAVRVLRRRSARLPGSPLYWLQAQALRRGGQVLESQEVARQGIERIVGAGLPISVDLLDWFTSSELRVVPSSEDVQRQIAQLDIVRPLRARAAFFIDREAQLRAIGSYVFADDPNPVLLIYGPGGIGKSSLVAKFVVDRLKDLELIYIDWSTLEKPSSSPPPGLDRLWQEVYRQTSLLRQGVLIETRDDRPLDPERLRMHFEALRDSNRPLLMVIDAVEGLQFQYGSELEPLTAVLANLKKVAPRLRVVLLSRIRPQTPRFEVFDLTSLPAEAAQAFLGAFGIESVDERRKVLALAGTSPLMLTLTAEAIRQSGPISLADISSEAKIAEHLLSRILDRISSPEVRALALGALAVRRVTAEVIEHVLAESIPVIAKTRARAEESLQSLVRDTSLFEQVGPGVIRTRSDARQVFRRSMAPGHALLQGIDQDAVAYYQTRDEPEFRAEEIFHRIMLGQTPEEIDARWMGGVEPFLQDVVSEVPGPMRTYLGVRLGLDVDIDPATADQATWEIYAAKRADALMQMGQLAEALDLIQQRSTRMRRSPLYALESQILLSLNRAREALVVGRRGLELWPDDTKLAAVVVAAERALGPDTAAQQSAAAKSTPASDVFWLLGAVAAPMVLAILKVALPTSTDVINAFRSLRGFPALMSSENLEKLVEWAASNHRLDELVTAAAQYAPENPALHQFLDEHAKKVEASGTDPITRVLLERGEVFLNRQTLRDFLRGLVSGEARSRVLVVNGPSRSGKSYTGVLASSVAQATGRLEYRRFEPTGTGPGLAFIQTIFNAFQWRWDTTAPSPAEPTIRRIRDLANIVRRKAEESRTTILLHVDAQRDRDLLGEALDFLRELIDQPGALALILSGFSKDWIPERALPNVVYEELSDLSLHVIEDGIAQVCRELNRHLTDAVVHKLAQGIISQVGPGLDVNVRINSSMKTLVSMLTDEAASV